MAKILINNKKIPTGKNEVNKGQNSLKWKRLLRFK